MRSTVARAAVFAPRPSRAAMRATRSSSGAIDPHPQRRLRVEQEVRAAADDDALAVAAQRQHHLGQVAQVVAGGEHAALDEARRPTPRCRPAPARRATRPPAGARAPPRRCRGSAPASRSGSRGARPPSAPSRRRARRTAARCRSSAAERPAFDPLALRDPPLFLPEQNLLVHEVIDAPDHRTSSASPPREIS